MSVIDFGIKRPLDFSPIPDQILEETIIPQFERIVQKYADRVAIKDSTRCLTYRELNNAINHLSGLIIQEVGENKSPIAFMLDDEFFSIITFMAVIKASKSYVGLHFSNSDDQLKSFLEDSDAVLLITCSRLKQTAQRIIGAKSQIKIIYLDEIQINSNTSAPEYVVAPNDLFGIFYTSGSTGKPKGVMSGHLYKSQSVHYMNNEWYFSPSDHIALLTSIYFGASYPSVMGALMSGALLCIFDLKANSAQQALDWIINEELTIFRSTPSIFRTVFGLASNGTIFSKLRFITLGGEPVTATDIDLFKAHTAKDCVLINNYASTETGSICHYPIRHNSPEFQGFLPAGFPAPGKEVMLVDENGDIVKDGQDGEIAVRSRYLNLGYWKQPELTAQKLQVDPSDPNFKIYFTGDRGRWRDDGVLEVLGRKDTQVKIRGYRVQLESIDMALRSIANITDAATIVHQDMIRGERLVAYFSASINKKISPSQLRNDLLTQLPSYMIPSAFIQMDSLPRTASGKLARLKLPEPSRERPDLSTPYQPPENELETEIALIWGKMLSIEQVGINDNFFDLGGDSLLALEMTLEVERAISKLIPQAFFKDPSISHLSILLIKENQPKTNFEDFQLESYRKNNQPKKLNRQKKSRTINLKKIIARKYSLNVFSKLTGFLVPKYIASKSYRTAVEWSIKWGQNSFVQNTLYAREYAIFTQWINDMKDCKVKPADAFQLSILNNLNFGLPKHSAKDGKGIRSGIQAYKKSKYKYWQTLGELLDATPPGQLNDYFPINGIENLLQAYEQKKGVILLTFHGVPTPGRFFTLERYLKLEKIPTISYQMPISQSEYHQKKHEIPDATAATLNAEIALFGQRILQEGKIINIVSDTHDYQGKTYKTYIAGRVYQIKGGFAELAINTGATIIPHFRYSAPDGKVILNIFPALQRGSGSREQQVENLINQYAAFIEHAWSTHPEVLRWEKIKKHLKRPTS